MSNIRHLRINGGQNLDEADRLANCYGKVTVCEWPNDQWEWEVLICGINRDDKFCVAIGSADDLLEAMNGAIYAASLNMVPRVYWSNQ